jgi:hypothetical protein
LAGLKLLPPPGSKSGTGGPADGMDMDTLLSKLVSGMGLKKDIPKPKASDPSTYCGNRVCINVPLNRRGVPPAAKCILVRETARSKIGQNTRRFVKIKVERMDKHDIYNDKNCLARARLIKIILVFFCSLL